jgi:hypothetical protein
MGRFNLRVLSFISRFSLRFEVSRATQGQQAAMAMQPPMGGLHSTPYRCTSAAADSPFSPRTARHCAAASNPLWKGKWHNPLHKLQAAAQEMRRGKQLPEVPSCAVKLSSGCICHCWVYLIHPLENPVWPCFSSS